MKSAAKPPTAIMAFPVWWARYGLELVLRMRKSGDREYDQFAAVWSAGHRAGERRAQYHARRPRREVRRG